MRKKLQRMLAMLTIGSLLVVNFSLAVFVWRCTYLKGTDAVTQRVEGSTLLIEVDPPAWARHVYAVGWVAAFPCLTLFGGALCVVSFARIGD